MTPRQSHKLTTLLLLISLFFQSSFGQTGGIPTGSDTTCLNGILLYQKFYGGNKGDLAEWLAVSSDSGYVIAGQTNSFGNGGFDGMLIKVNKNGNTVWNKAIGGSNNDVFYGIKRTVDNGFIVAGQTKSYGNSAGDAWLVKTDATGNILWSKKYGNGNAFGDAAFEVTQLSDGGFAFCGVHQYAGGVSQSLIVRTDNSGNVIWSKLYDQPGSDEAWGILEDGNSLLVIGFYRAPDLYDGYLMKLDKTNGAVQWKRTYDADFGRHLLMHKISTTSSGFQVLSYLMDDFSGTNLQQCVWNLASDGTVLNVRKLVVPGIQTSGYGWTPLTDGSFVVANGENNNGADIIFTKVNAGGNIEWSKKYLRSGRQWIRAMIASPEGGYAAVGMNNNAGLTTDSNDVNLIRFDHTGSQGSCTGINTSEVVTVSPSFSSSVISAGAPSDLAINNPVITTGLVSFVPATITACTYCYIPVITDTSCVNGTSFYQKVYGGNKDDYGFYLAPTSDSGFVVAGRTASYGNGGSDGLLMKVNKNGSVSWSKAIGGTGNDYFQTVIRTSDNGYIAVGQTKSYGNPAGDAWLVKTDFAGNIQWSRKYGDGNVNGDIGFDVTELTEGGFVFCGTHRYAPGTAEGFVVRTDNQGNVIWSRQYGNGGSDQLWGITEDGSSVVVAGFYQAGSFYDGYVMKLDKVNGNIQWIRGIDGENRSTQFYRIRRNGAGFQMMGLGMDDYNTTNQQNYIWNLNADGTVQNVRKMVIPGIQNLDFGWYPRSDGGFISVNGDYTANSDLYISNVNPDGSLAWSKKYLRAGQQFINNLMPSPEGGYAGVGYNNNIGALPLDSNEVYLIRIDSLGNAGNCSGINTAEVTVSSPSFSLPTPNVVSLGNVTINNPVITAGVVTFVPTTNTLCFYCQGKPTGTARPQNTGERSWEPHTVNVFPNPVINGTFQIEIEALYDDNAIISIIDLNGNVLYTTSPREIIKGQNLFRIDLPVHVRNYSNYLVGVQFKNYTTTSKIFVIR